MKKKVLAMLLSLALLASILPALTVPASAAGTCRLSTNGPLKVTPGTVLPELPAGTYFTTTGGTCTGHSNESTCATAVNLTYAGGSTYIDLYGATQCLSFAYYCMYRYTGVPAEQQHKLVYKQISSCDGIVETHTDDMRSFSVADIKDILINLPAGSHLRIYRGSYNHSMILLSASDSGVIIYDCNRFNDYHCRVSIEEKSYQWMTDYINGSGSGRHGFSYIHSPVETHVHDMQTFLPHPAYCNWPGMTRVFYQCMSCQKIYLDQAGLRQITFDQAYDLPIDPNNHDGDTEIRNAKAATDTEAGYTGDTYCKGCGKLIAKGEVIPAKQPVNPTPETGPTNSDVEITPPSNQNPITTDVKFTDVPSGAWFSPAVDYVVREKLMSGVGNATFAPNEPLTRSMLAQILYNKANRPTVKTNSFSDVTSEAWYADAISWVVSRGIASGYGDGRFGPNDSITREQLVAILWRYNGSPIYGGDWSEMGYTDTAEISDYADMAMMWAVATDVINGNNGKLMPKDTASRSQVAQILMNYFENNK